MFDEETSAWFLRTHNTRFEASNIGVESQTQFCNVAKKIRTAIMGIEKLNFCAQLIDFTEGISSRHGDHSGIQSLLDIISNLLTC